MQTKNVVTKDGIALMHRMFLGDQSEKVAFITHSQAQHTLNLKPTMLGLSEKGWTVHGTDLRGHGFSSGPRAPLAHMDLNSGWDLLVDDLRLGYETAFAGTSWEDRLVVAPNIGAPLTIEVLKTWTDLAKHIVFVTPPANQPALLKLGRSFAKARSHLHPVDAPDELILNQLYSFFGARLADRERLIDVVSSDRKITDMLLDDEFAWPTPTTGYFHEMFRGIDQAWKWPDKVSVKDGTSILILYGGDDPVTANGKFVAKMREHLIDMGISNVDAHCVENGRSGLVIEEERFGISTIIHQWVTGCLHTEFKNDLGNLTEITSNVLNKLGLQSFDAELSADELVELCYDAIDNESRWIETLYRVAYAISTDESLDEKQLEAILLAIMPHWERSFQLNKQVMQSAALGAVLQNVIDRLSIGMAIVSDDMTISYANDQFFKNFSAISDGMENSADLDELSNLLKAQISSQFISQCKTKAGEALLVLDETPVGFHFRPQALKQTSLKRGGASGVLILRPPELEKNEDHNLRQELIQFAYGLTIKEAEAACCIIDGLSPHQMATQLGISINTARTHLKRVYEKIGVQGQSELTSRLLKGPIGLLSDGN